MGNLRGAGEGKGEPAQDPQGREGARPAGLRGRGCGGLGGGCGRVRTGSWRPPPGWRFLRETLSYRCPPAPLPGLCRRSETCVPTASSARSLEAPLLIIAKRCQRVEGPLEDERINEPWQAHPGKGNRGSHSRPRGNGRHSSQGRSQSRGQTTDSGSLDSVSAAGGWGRRQGQGVSLKGPQAPKPPDGALPGSEWGGGGRQ